MQGCKDLKTCGICRVAGQEKKKSVMKEVMARFPTGLYPEGNGELLLKNRNDIRFAFMKHHFGHRMGEQLREWYAYLQE